MITHAQIVVIHILNLCARNNISQRSNNCFITNNINLRQTSKRLATRSQRRSNKANSSLQLILCGNNIKVGNCSRSSWINTCFNQEVLNIQVVLVCIRDGVDTNVIVASFSNYNFIILKCCEVSEINIRSRNNLGSQSRSLGLCTQLHLNTLRILGSSSSHVDSEVILLTTLQLNSRRNKPVVTIISRAIRIAHSTNRRAEAPCLTVLITINNTKLAKQICSIQCIFIRKNIYRCCCRSFFLTRSSLSDLQIGNINQIIEFVFCSICKESIFRADHIIFCIIGHDIVNKA